jgi:segregation and condensation protein B
LLQSQLPPGFRVPSPNDSEETAEDEDPLSPGDLEELGLLPPKSEDEEPRGD